MSDASKRSPRRLLSRFERRLLLAIAAVAAVSLTSALGLGYYAMRDAYQVGVNPRLGARLGSTLELYRKHFLALRRGAEQSAAALSHDRRISAALEGGDRRALERQLRRALAESPSLARIEVRGGGGAPLAEARREERLDRARFRPLVLEREVSGEGASATLVLTFAAPRELFEEYRRTGEEEEVYRRLLQSTEYLSSGYLAAFIGSLLSVILIALAVGLVIGRRITRRVALLAEATQRVGRGELTFALPTDERDELGELTGAFNRMVKDLRESRDRIDYLSRISAWQDFARRLAHEIKNPLTPIQLAVQQVHRKYRGEDRVYAETLDETLEIVEEEIRTLRRLVGEFSEFARLPVAALEPADLGEFVREAMRGVEAATLLGGRPGRKEHGRDEESASSRSGEPAIEIQLEIAEEPMPVEIDAMMLRRVLDNLVRNGAESILDDDRQIEGRRRVVVGARREGSEALLEVRDDGPGVAEEKRADIFNPYFTTKSEGTGLGLAIVKKVILEHQGSITCVEAREGGASFEIRIPCVGGERPG